MTVDDQFPSTVPHDRQVSRRRLLQTAGVAAGLTVAWSSREALGQDAVSSPEAGATPEATPVSPPSPFSSEVDSYLRINPDGTVTLMTGKVEFGQGIRTGFAQLIAEELSIPFESVLVILGQTDQTPFDLGTFGSLSMRLTGPRIRQSGAAMRVWLSELGAAQLGQDISAVSLSGGAVVVTDDPTQMVSFADLAAGQATMRELDPEIAFKDPATYTVIGQSIPRPDVIEKVDGSLKYGIDGTIEGMVWGKIVRPPSFGATLTSIDFTEAEVAPGVVGVFHDGNFAGLAAERYEQAEAAIMMVQATWEELPATTTSENIHQVLLDTADEGVRLDETNVEPASDFDILAGITEPIELTFRGPFVSHTPIEPRNSLVQITPERVDVMTSTQDPFGVRRSVAEVLGREPETVVVTPMATGGAFGAKIVAMADVEAARLAQAFGRPVKVLWRRDEELAHGQYRPATLVSITTGLDGQGGIGGWLYNLYSASYFPENVERSEDTQNGAASDWSANIHEIYEIPNAQTFWFHSASTLPPYFWRVNGATMNTFAREVTLDVLAEMEGVDPVAFRRNLLGGNPRMMAVMDAALAKAGWTPGVGSTGTGYGIALGFDANSYVAEVARVEIDQNTGEVFVRHVDVAIDCGLVINPEAVKHQVEGSVVLGVSSALREIIKFEGGRVTNPSFAEYAPITMRESPTVDTVFVEDKSQPMSGVGEPAVAPVAGAIANAIYDLVGIRLYDLPFTADRVLAELQKQTGAATPVAVAAD
ncbi:MAG: Isoquinoline 1-oxidoreductase beta subunit [uncultured Thermomicrobiales bacterium]|uniref:Isoquinoline 1-oxidoreductase beta subunit n=1 Tax=uncultured Thermomicrobiales bacterium TaxID=1645740 RepID=A0A6J4UY16_9BACT|nr:MAG: Isoquinoline 1-oxidoreductase beta subunit [uncultured Thermomicrobiales bacterium]